MRGARPGCVAVWLSRVYHLPVSSIHKSCFQYHSSIVRSISSIDLLACKCPRAVYQFTDRKAPHGTRALHGRHVANQIHESYRHRLPLQGDQQTQSKPPSKPVLLLQPPSASTPHPLSDGEKRGSLARLFTPKPKGTTMSRMNIATEWDTEYKRPVTPTFQQGDSWVMAAPDPKTGEWKRVALG